jgi:hypothetical protein
MDRERKLLYIVAILAPIVEGLMFAQFYQPEAPTREALLTQVHECQEKLFRAWAACRSAGHHKADI